MLNGAVRVVMQFVGPNDFGWQRSIKLLIVSSFLTILGFSAVCVSVMFDMRHSEEELARQAGENIASTIDADITRNIEIYDLSLRAVANNLTAHEIGSVSRELRHLILFDHSATAKHFGAIQVFNASGNLTIDSSSLDPEPLNMSGAEFFRIHRDNPDLGLFVSRPLIHRGAQAVILSRRINDQDGQFQGVVAGTIRFGYFHELFGGLRLGDNETITVLRRDGIVMMHTPFDRSFIGRDISAVSARMLTEPAGHMSGTSPLDGISRLLTWHGSDKLFVVVVGKPWSGIYAMWNRQAIWIGSVLAVLIAFAALVTCFLAREIARRARAEETLKELATTDALTDLRNRRKFDEQLDLEWRRCARGFQPLSLLLVDVDHFKVFNDRFGHQAGDRALASVGAFIATSAKRPGDCAARYGGEEFALLLPGTRLADAHRIAEEIRVRIARGGDVAMPLTVSIGVATLTPDGSASPDILVELADRALYGAKRTGRNRTTAASAKASARVA